MKPQARPVRGRFNQNAIYDDPNLGYYDDPALPQVLIDVGYKIQWPEGYWDEYELLRKEAATASKAIILHMVMCLNGKYSVYAVLPARLGESGEVWGLERNDRLTAWKAFIGGFTPIVLPAGEVKLGPNKNSDVMVVGKDLEDGLKKIADSMKALQVKAAKG